MNKKFNTVAATPLNTTTNISVRDHEVLNRSNSEAATTPTTPAIEERVTMALRSLTNKIISNGNNAQSATSAPSANPLLKITRETAAGLINGSKLPKNATKAACIRPRIVNSAKARIG
ncbi:MAG: hypothetical protein JKY85_05470 [Porticoccus sp.]|nr:hypothetical protein [Porticoccus sp.]